MATLTKTDEILLDYLRQTIRRQAAAYGPGTRAVISESGAVSYIVPKRPGAVVQEIRRPSHGRGRAGGFVFRSHSWGMERPVTEKSASAVSTTRRAEVTRAVNYIMGPARSPLVRWFYPSARDPSLRGLSNSQGWEIWLRDGLDDVDAEVAVTAVHELWHLATPDMQDPAAEREATAMGLEYWRTRISQGGNNA